MTQWFGTKEEFVYFGWFGLEGEGELAQFAMRHLFRILVVLIVSSVYCFRLGIIVVIRFKLPVQCFQNFLTKHQMWWSYITLLHDCISTVHLVDSVWQSKMGTYDNLFLAVRR